ncbi:MAG: HAD-IIB family hydrolase, partial [Minisyncoccia bacterium]
EEMSELLCELLKLKKVAVISGASMEQFQKQFLDYLICPRELLNNLYLLPTDGAALYEYVLEWKCVYNHNLSKDEKIKIFEAFERTFIDTGFKKEQVLYGELIEDRGSQITFSGLGMKAPIVLKEKWDPDQKKRRILIESLQKKLPEYSIKIGGTTSIDITLKGIDKAYGILELMKHLNYTKEQVFYVGDAFYKDGNDTSIERLNIGFKAVGDPGIEDTKILLRTLINKLKTGV